MDSGVASPRKECLQSDLDDLSVAISRLENMAEKFALTNAVKESIGQEKPSDSEPMADILRRRVQMSAARVREITNVLEKEFSKIS